MSGIAKGAHGRGLRVEYVLIAVFLVLLVVTLAFLYSPSVAPPPPPINATKLTIITSGSARVGEKLQLRIQAVDSQGRWDRLRNDMIRITASPTGVLSLDKSVLSLHNGEALVDAVAIISGTIRVTASWVSGYSQLDPGSTVITVS